MCPPGHRAPWSPRAQVVAVARRPGRPHAPAPQRDSKWKPDTGQPRSPCRRPRTWCGYSSPGGAAKLGGGCGGWARPALASDDERGAARRGGQGGGGAGASDSQERRGDLSPSSLRNRQRLRTQHPQPRAPPRRRLSPPPLPCAWREPPDGRTDGRAGLSEPAPLERCHTWRSQVYSTENAPEARREETAREEHALGRLSVTPKPQHVHQTTSTRGARAEQCAGSKRHFSPGPRTASERRVRPVRTVPAFSCSVTISQNPITSQSKPPAIGQWGG